MANSQKELQVFQIFNDETDRPVVHDFRIQMNKKYSNIQHLAAKDNYLIYLTGINNFGSRYVVIYNIFLGRQLCVVDARDMIDVDYVYLTSVDVQTSEYVFNLVIMSHYSGSRLQQVTVGVEDCQMFD